VNIPEDKMASALGIIDKVEKIGKEKVVKMLVEIGVDESAGRSLITLLTDVRNTMKQWPSKEELPNSLFTEGSRNLKALLKV